ncbi:hypothetical protein L1049_012944 [Liquidambar formosana]|uniref:Homeobox domain-containing protein n=1 Tax=Liquidambar formosana TaxID=63359 RepID=A0AAP0WXL2_LIQFO
MLKHRENLALEGLMEMSNFRPESHVAQQSRRDKLRIQQSSIEGFPNNLEQLSVHPGLNPDLIQVRNVRNAKLLYDSTALSSEMLNFSTNSNVLLSHKDAMVHQASGAAPPDRQIAAEDALFANSSYPISSNFNPSSKPTGDPQNCGNWKSMIASQQGCDWIVNYASGSAGRGSNQMFNSISASTPYMKPSYNGFQDVVQSSLTTNPSSEISSQDSPKHYGEMQHFNSSPIYQNTLQEVVTSGGRGSWEVGGNGLVFLPAYGDQPNALRLNNASAWINRPVEGSHQWSGELGFLANKSDGDLRTVASDSNTQGLSLSLSSNPPTDIHAAQFAERYGSEAVHSKTGVFNVSQDSKPLKSGYSCSNLKPSIIGSKGCGSSLQDIVGTSASAHRNSGPLGPFTGYATILKSSKFLKPAQQLLDEFCSVIGQSTKFIETGEVSERISGEVSGSVDAVNVAETEIGVKDGNSGASSSTFRGSNEHSSEGGVVSSSYESHRPEYQQKKAKLLYMQEEVCRRYKQYHQQMHMVVSSFESVAGLSAAAPYISLALKTVSRHFRCLKSAISDQLRHISKALGEDLSSLTSGTSSSKGDITMSRMRFLNQSFQKHKSIGENMGFLEPQQHIWRPQRGLPERAVAVLRAWLFEHFLHPYPTDTDKHMLATQTGLTRNQVSNWFINARVRVWKPMVEEIHTLETKGSAETDLNSGKNDGISISEGSSRPNGSQALNKLSMNASTEKRMECCGVGSSAGTADGLGGEQWNQEKRLRVEGQITASMDGSLMGFMPYQRNGLEIGGIGTVSLTLGLRHSAESTQQQQQQLQRQEHLLRQHFGGQMIHDFVG